MLQIGYSAHDLRDAILKQRCHSRLNSNRSKLFDRQLGADGLAHIITDDKQLVHTKPALVASIPARFAALWLIENSVLGGAGTESFQKRVGAIQLTQLRPSGFRGRDFGSALKTK